MMRPLIITVALDNIASEGESDGENRYHLVKYTALYWAVLLNHVEVAALLLDRGSDIEHPTMVRHSC